ncbi:MAG TPA: glutaminyl-peptide cyclotransferase [Aggregatilineales bacterium]|nr:glutaminyl-peptide cyclotransferase [Anaerolineales bacterium]HRE47002.1 glutaminyl-peptide cyclotransferase [Aggregatilineales bacterium]
MHRRFLILVCMVVLLTGCEALNNLAKRAVPPQRLITRILNTYSHDSTSYTQGLLLYNGLFYESGGQYRESTLRLVQPETGEVLKRLDLPPDYFAEGLALVGDRLIQITWREGKAFAYDRETFNLVETFAYEGEGWGLCYDGESLYMSDGSPYLVARDPTTFAELRRVLVVSDGRPVMRLNELECVGDSVYANIWFEDRIIQINKKSGAVTAEIDASGLLSPPERAMMDGGAVLNGIAYNPERKTFYITGKYWGKLFEVEFVPR